MIVFYSLTAKVQLVFYVLAKYIDQDHDEEWSVVGGQVKL